ncbi:MAG: hypothetical protein SangKO_099160 [Sandaracinaceae bacterium]
MSPRRHHQTPTATAPGDRTLNHTMRLSLLAAFGLALTLSACDTAGPGTVGPTGPDPIQPITSGQQALVTAAFQEVEELFNLGFSAASGARSSSARLHAPDGSTSKDATSLGGASSTTAVMASMRARVDTTTYTGIYDTGNSRGYLVQLQYRQPQGVGVWTARVQHARAVDHDGDGGATTAALDAVESVTLTFLTYADLDAFVTALGAGTNAYLVGTSDDAEASFSSYDTWRVAQVYSPAEGEAVVSYANQELRESVTVREPIATLNTNGTGTLRDGGPGGSVRTRYYGADFAIDADGDVTGTLLRTLTSKGDLADGSLVSRNDYPDASFRQTKQRGGDGVVIRENTEG